MKEDKNYYIVDKAVLPEIFLKVMDVKNLLESKKEKTVQDAVNRVGISRSAFYKYKDAVQPFQDMKAGHIITFYALLRDNPGVLSSCLSIFAGSGANVLTINQTIPTNGCAGVTISAETSEMHEGLEEMIAQVSGADGVLKFEILAG